MSNRRKKAKKKVTKKKAETPKLDETEVEAIDVAQKLTDVEALQFGKLDAEIRNNLQAIEINKYQLDAYTRDFANKKAALEQDYKEKKATIAHMQAHHQEEMKRLKPLYDDLVATLAKKYGISDPKSMVVDPDNGTVRDVQVNT